MAMNYSNIQPPFTLRFREMSRDELKAYRKWFLGIIPERLGVLRGAMILNPSFATWTPDHSRASVEKLGSWLSQQVETRTRTSAEIERIKARLVFEVEVPAQELTIRTFSLAMDAGMYFGETLRRQYPQLKWDQPLRNKNFADYGQIVLLGFGRVPLNPVHIAVAFCHAVASGRQESKRFDDVYAYWSNLAEKQAGEKAIAN